MASVICPCGFNVPKGTPCDCAAKRRVANQKRNDTARGSAASRGYDLEWVKARSKQLARFPTCVSCGGRATMVDHIQSIRKAPQLRLEPSNFASMCASCHAKKGLKHDGLFGRKPS